jgi:cellulose synthase/poly-beta-1,6-N-acetylglucosamine synthase-like glycosyltransferase
VNALAAMLFVGCAISLALALHPFTTYPLSLRLLLRWVRAPLNLVPLKSGLRVAVCVCAYNEEQVIRARLENILSLRATEPDLDILVYVDGASDRTSEFVRSFGDSITAVISSERLGKTHGMNSLIALTQADIIVFSDANVTFAPDAVDRLTAVFSDETVGCVCGHLRYAKGDNAVAETGSLYWRLEESIKAMESATGSVMGADGSIFAVRRHLHRPPPAHLIDDMYLSLSILCNGARIVRAHDAIAYESAVSTSQEEFRRKMRIACQSFNVHRALWPRLLHLDTLNIYKYVSHKLLRWLCAYSMAASGILFLAALAVARAWPVVLVTLGFGIVGATIIWFAPRGIAATLREVILAIIATALGVLQSLRGEQFQTWTPPASARSTATMGTNQLP